MIDETSIPGDGIAGASARREYARRKANDERRIRERWGRFGGLVLALSNERQSTKSWERGAIGEERLGLRLDSLLAPVAVLHDRRIPGSRANIDHLVVTPASVWVVDAKRYAGRPERRVEGGLLRPRVERLLVAGRDKTKLLEGVRHQVELVQSAVPNAPVIGALCFVDADWPLISGSFMAQGVHVLWPKRLAKQLTAEAGPLEVDTIRRKLAARFPAA